MVLDPLVLWFIPGFLGLILLILIVSLLIRSRTQNPEIKLLKLLRKRKVREAAEFLVELRRSAEAIELLIRERRQADAAGICLRTGEFDRAGFLLNSVGDHEAAVEAYTQGGNFTEAAAILERIGRSERAAELFARAGRLKDAARLFLRARKYQKAGEIHRRLGDRIGTARMLALHHSEAGDVEAAVEMFLEAGDLKKAIDLCKRRKDWGVLSRLMERLGRPELAAQFRNQQAAQRGDGGEEDLPAHRARLEEALRNDPDDLKLLLELADVHRSLGDPAAATTLLEESAGRFRAREVPTKAVAVLKRLLEIAPDRREVHGGLGALYLQLGHKDEAIAQYKLQIEFLVEQGRTLDALRALDRIVDLSPDAVVDRLHLAEAYVRHLEFPAAARRYREALARLDAQGGDDGFWIRIAERYLHHVPDDLGTVQRLAEKLAAADRHAEAMCWLQRCVAKDPGAPIILETFATCLEALGQPDKADAVLGILAGIYGHRGLVAEQARVLERLVREPTMDPEKTGEPIADGEVLTLDWDLPASATQRL